MAGPFDVLLTRIHPESASEASPTGEDVRLIHPTATPSPLRSGLGFKVHRLILRGLSTVGLGNLLLGDPISADKNRDRFLHYTLLHPAETLDFADPALGYQADPFLRSCQGIDEGRLHRGNIFVCEIPSAKFSAEHGLVCDFRWRGIIESALDKHRFNSFKRTFRPRTWETRTGVYSSVQHAWHFNNWHWIADCLPQVYSLIVHMQGRPLTLLMSAGIFPVHRQSLECLLPPNFKVEYVDLTRWFELETFVLPSFVSSRANACFPPDYFEFIRGTTYRNLGIAKPDRATGRYYISRNRAKHRRVTNEPEIESLLAAFGFEKIYIEDYTFRQQVELFRNSEAIVSPHGAALGSIVYAEDLKLCVLYSQLRPAGYFYTLARGLGHRHFCTNANKGENEDFPVDPAELRRVLTEEMHLG